jgi:ribosomal protein L37AE/L43A
MEHRVNPRDWLEEGELERCPSCGERAVIRTDTKLAVCLACSVAWIVDGEPQPI